MAMNLVQKVSHRMMRLVARMMPSCKEISQRVSLGMDSKLPLPKRLALRLHISMCALCQRYEKQLHLLRPGVARYANPEENVVEDSLSPAARERLKQALEQQS